MSSSSNLAKRIPSGEDAPRQPHLREVKAEVMHDPLDVVLNRKTIRQQIKEFADVFAIILTAVAGYSLYKQGSSSVTLACLAAATIIFALGMYAPRKLHGFWKGWLKVGEWLGLAVTFAILSAVWVGLFIPISLILKLFGKSVMNMNFHEPKQSYWENRNPEQDNFALLQRQY